MVLGDTNSITTPPARHRPDVNDDRSESIFGGAPRGGIQIKVHRLTLKTNAGWCGVDPLTMLRMESLTAKGETLPLTVVWQLRKLSRHHGLCFRSNGELP